LPVLPSWARTPANPLEHSSWACNVTLDRTYQFSAFPTLDSSFSTNSDKIKRYFFASSILNIVDLEDTDKCLDKAASLWMPPLSAKPGVPTIFSTPPSSKIVSKYSKNAYVPILPRVHAHVFLTMSKVVKFKKVPDYQIQNTHTAQRRAHISLSAPICFCLWNSNLLIAKRTLCHSIASLEIIYSTVTAHEVKNYLFYRYDSWSSATFRSCAPFSPPVPVLTYSSRLT
jgi:hypothetical protein